MKRCHLHARLQRCARPLHTHEHALPLVNFRLLSVVTSSSAQCCAASRVPYRLYRNSISGCPLSVSAHPVITGALPVSREQVSLEILVYILWRRMYSTSSRLAWAHNSGSSHPALLSSQSQPSHKSEQLLLVMIHESAHFVFHVTQVFALVFVVSHEQSCISSSHLPSFLFFSRVS